MKEIDAALSILDKRTIEEIDFQRYNDLQRLTREFVPRSGGLILRGCVRANPKRSGDERKERAQISQWKLTRAKTAEQQYLEEISSSEEPAEHVIWKDSEPSAPLNLTVEPLTVQLGQICPELAQMATS